MRQGQRMNYSLASYFVQLIFTFNALKTVVCATFYSCISLSVFFISHYDMHEVIFHIDVCECTHYISQLLFFFFFGEMVFGYGY